MGNTGIEIVQIPVIKQNLAFMGEQVTERLNALNIDKQIATTDTVKSLKELRAELNKELADFEAQRKFVKESVLKPYSDFEDLYKTQISEKYKSAIDTLKDKISIVEDEIKREKKANIEAYFTELCVAEKIDFLKFENAGLEINLSTSEKAYKEKINELINRVKDDLALIETQEYKAEVLVEYKSTLNAARAIKAIQDRKEKEMLEQERIRLTEIDRRITTLKIYGFKLNDFTKDYDFNADIFMSKAEIEETDRKTFTKTLDILVVKIENIRREEAERKERERLAQQNAKKQEAEISPEEYFAPVFAEALQAPTVQGQPRTQAVTKESLEQSANLVAEFRVTTTREKIYLLRDFLIANQINYTNI